MSKVYVLMEQTMDGEDVAGVISNRNAAMNWEYRDPDEGRYATEFELDDPELLNLIAEGNKDGV